MVKKQQNMGIKENSNKIKLKNQKCYMLKIMGESKNKTQLVK